MIFIYFYWCLLPRYECFGGCALTDSFSLPQKAMAENQTQPPDGTLNPSACFFLSLTWKIWWELDRDMAVMGGLEVEFLKWRSAPWSRLTTYFDNPQSREAGSIDGIDGIDMKLKWIDIYWNMNWHDMKSRKTPSQVFCANAGDSRCVLARHCAQWVGWRMLEAAHRQQMGVYCWLCLYSFLGDTHVSYSFGEVTKVDYTSSYSIDV